MNENKNISWLYVLVLGIALGVVATLLWSRYIPRAIGDGEYQLALPQDGAFAVKNLSSGKPDFFTVPPEAVNFLVNPQKAWTVQVTARGLYRLVTVYVPSDEYMPSGMIRQPTQEPPENFENYQE